MQQPPNPYPQDPQQQSPMPQQQQWNPQQTPFTPQQYQQTPQYQPPMLPPKKSSKGLFIILGVILVVTLVGCVGVAAMVNAGGQSAQQALNQPPTQVAQLPTIQPTTQPITKSTQAPTTGTKVHVHLDSSIQDAAQSWSHGVAKSGESNGIVWVTDVGAWNANPNDYTWGLPMIQLDCFNIQQAIWYGLKSTINTDGSTTVIKSDFKEVDITFLTTFKANAQSFASCRLTSPTVDKIDKAGMWTYGDSVGAWAMYDSISIQ
jgi:hypothetical protein